nr:MAG TPA: hypothetical protein [Caudoviricetes sp.]
MKNLGKVDNPLSVPRKKDLTATAEAYAPIYIHCGGTIKDKNLTDGSGSLKGLCVGYINAFVNADEAVQVGVQRPVLLASFDGTNEKLGWYALLQLCDYSATDSLVNFSGIADDSGTLYNCSALFDLSSESFVDTSYTRIENEVFIAVAGTTEFAEVEDAYNNGKAILAIKDNDVYQLSWAEVGTQYVFVKTNADFNSNQYTTSGYILENGSGWGSLDNLVDANMPTPYKGNPSAPGTAAPGKSDNYARGDHVHPSEVFIATYGVTTQAQLEEAYNAGKIPVLFYENSMWTYVRIGAWPGFVNLTATTHDVGGYTTWDWRVTGYFISNNQWTPWLQKYLVPQDRKINNKALSSDITLGVMYSATLTSAGWTTSGDWKTQTVSVTGLKATYNAAPFVDVTLTGTDATGDAELAAAWLGISETLIADTAANSITVKFPATVDTPTVNIPITITTYD